MVQLADLFQVRQTPGLRHDRQFLLAMLAGPVCWVLAARYTGRPIDPAWPLHHAWSWLLAVLIYPPLEEMVFRGWLQPALATLTPRGFAGVTAANLLASLAFAAAHLLRHSPLAAASVLLPSLVFGYFCERHRGLTAPVCLHVWYNAGWIWLVH